MIIDFEQAKAKMKDSELGVHKNDIEWLLNEFTKTANEYTEHQKNIDSLMAQLEQSRAELNEIMKDLF